MSSKKRKADEAADELPTSPAPKRRRMSQVLVDVPQAILSKKSPSASELNIAICAAIADFGRTSDEADIVSLERLLSSDKLDLNAPSDKGISPMFIAAQLDLAVIAKMLLKSGASLIEPRSSDGESPLEVACREGNAAVIKVFSDHIAELEKQRA